jgi:hypothetical protein
MTEMAKGGGRGWGYSLRVCALLSRMKCYLKDTDVYEKYIQKT